MCGIGGILVDLGSAPVDLRAQLARMAGAMRHRGPDDEGLYLAPDGRAGLATRRLAIRDLSPAGHMPMGNPAATVWITYNGEIYNTAELRDELARCGYRFRSQSDTEVILHGYEAWGPDVVERLRGMFAFAILDLRAGPTGGQLFLARDRLGVKPLYYARADRVFLFASELKALRATGLLSREVAPAALAGYLLLGAVPNPLTIQREIRSLEPGCTLSLPLADPAARPCPARYWALPGTVAPCDEDEAVERIRALLAEAVRIRLVSDVPLGAFLSGGLDSSAIVALMRQATAGPIRTCSMAFEEASYNEALYARAMADVVGAEHHERVINAADVARELPAFLTALDQPSVDGINTYFVAQTAREAGLTVALSGLGGDELFGGYPSTFDGVPRLLAALRVVRAIPAGVPLADAALGRLPAHARWARVRAALHRPATPASAYLARRGLFAPDEVAALLTPDAWAEARLGFDPVRHIGERTMPGGRPAAFAPDDFAWISRAELGTYTHHQLLRDTDAMSMAHSLEVRVPFLDHRLVELVLGLPAATKRAGSGPKPLLTRALGVALPAVVRAPRGKQGFTLPFEPWLRGPLNAPMTELLHTSVAGGLLRAEAVEAVWRGYLTGKMHWSRPWALAMLAAAGAG